MRKISRVLALVIAGLPVGLFLGCTHNDEASMRVTLVDGPLAGYQEINLDIQRLEIKGDGGWITLSTPKKVVNLLGLVGGVSEVLADGATLPEGHYGQMRLVLGTANTVKLADGSTVALTVPSGLQSGVKLVVSFDVAAGTTKDVWIDFDAAHSVQLVGTGASAKVILRPTVWAYDKIVTGSISGRFTDDAGAPLAGAPVMAQVLDGNSQPLITRTVPTAADGSYTLDLLPVGYTYFVVSQPVIGTTSYQAKASQGFSLTGSTPTFTYSASFAAAAGTGTVNGTFATAAEANQHDVVTLLQTFSQGTFIVRSAIAEVAGTVESCSFAQVPTGAYSAKATRITTALDGSTTSTTTMVPSLTVTAGGTTTLAF